MVVNSSAPPCPEILMEMVEFIRLESMGQLATATLRLTLMTESCSKKACFRLF